MCITNANATHVLACVSTRPHTHRIPLLAGAVAPATSSLITLSSSAPLLLVGNICGLAFIQALRFEVDSMELSLRMTLRMRAHMAQRFKP
jgi:hypothetical protein